MTKHQLAAVPAKTSNPLRSTGRFADFPTIFDNFLTHSVGFDDFFDRAFGLVEKQAQVTYPPYNVKKIDETHYAVELAVAGFTEDNLNVEVQDNILTVKGTQTQTTEQTGETYTHKGIAARSFSRSFHLPEHCEATDATLQYGLLTVILKVEPPPTPEPKRLKIVVA